MAIYANGDAGNVSDSTYAGEKQGSFSLLDYDFFCQKKQANCVLCDSNSLTAAANPTTSERCAEHLAHLETFSSNLFRHLKRHRKVVRLHRCFGYSDCFAPPKMSVILGLCKKCFKFSQSAKNRQQIANIANKLNPAKLDDSVNASDGRPLVAAVRVGNETKYAVISGNHRTEGIKDAYLLDN